MMFDKHIFARWQAALCALLLLAEGLYLPQGTANWLAVLTSAIAAAVLLPVLLKLPGGLIDAACAVLAVLLPIQTTIRMYRFWGYAGVQPVLAAVFLLLTAWFLARRGADCLFMWSFPVAVTAVVLLLLSVAVTAPDWQPAHLEMPGLPPFLHACGWMLPRFLVFLIPARLAGSAKAPAVGILLGGALLSLLCLRTLLLLGSTVYVYPNYAAAGLAAVGDFLRRCEVVFGTVLALCECARAAVCFAFLRTRR